MTEQIINIVEGLTDELIKVKEEQEKMKKDVDLIKDYIIKQK